MKNKLLILFVIIFATMANLRADQLEDAAKQYTSSNTVPITTNLMFFLSSEHYGFPVNQFKSDELILTGIGLSPLLLSGTNRVYIRYLSFPFNQTYDFHLFNDKGKEVQKTEQGLANSKPAHLPTSMNDLNKLRSVVVIGGIANTLFRPEEMFVITNQGVYTMEIRMRICVPMTNGLPNYEVMQNLKEFPHEPYGAVTSKPLRVKVIKE